MLNWIKRLLAPPRFPNDDEKDRIAGLLNIILLALTAVFAVNTIVAILFNPVFSATLLNGGTVLFTLGLLVTLHRRHVTAAAWITVILFWLLVSAIAFTLSGLSTTIITSYIVLVVLAGVLTGNVSLFIILGLNLIVGATIYYLESTGRFVPALAGSRLVNITSSAGNMVVLGVLVGLTLRTLGRTLADSRKANKALQEAQVFLEARVAERTRDLALASEVGRSLALVHDLDTLLKEASGLIRERFNLYHVQIYLTDSNQQSLILRAGTGHAARELLSRRHNLAISAGSINGSAALNKEPVIVTNTRESSLFRSNPLLPETRSEMAVPLLIGNRVLGVLDLQSAEPGSLTEDSLPAFETVASQLAVSIDNANLFTVASEAREEVESYLHRLTREGWSDYLDTISRDAKLAYVYDAEGHTADKLANEAAFSDEKNVMRLPITVANEPIGVIKIEADETYQWTDEVMSTVSTVAQQVGQQVENLRLLNEAQRYQSEAEAAVRRITQSAWREQLKRQQELATGFAYDGQQVMPLEDVEEEMSEAPPATALPLQVRGETIGNIDLYGDVNPETHKFVQSVSASLSEHLENLRLSEQTELALADSQRRSTELAVINKIASITATQLEMKPLLENILEQLRQVLRVDSFMVSQYDKAKNQSRILFSYDPQVGMQTDLPAVTLEPHHITYQIVHSKQPKLILYSEAEIEEQRQNPPPNMLSEEHTVMASLMFVPMLRGEEVVGVLAVQSYDVHAYDESDLSLVNGIASYVSTALQNVELFTEIQRQGEKEHIINVISQRIQSTLTVDEALQTAVSELGKALKARSTQAELMAFDQTQTGNGRSANGHD